jgi:hypothetical protein
MPGLFDQYFASKRLLAHYLAQIGHGILSLPQRATEAAGSLQYGGSYDPGPALETAGLVALGSFPLRGSAAAGSLASKSAGLYNPPAKPPRPFAADYPSGAPADASGRLTADIEGRRLTGRYLVGRKVVGGNDQALPPAEFDALTEATTGRSAKMAPASALGHDVGRVALAPYTRAPQEVYLSRRLTRQQAERVYAPRPFAADYPSGALADASGRLTADIEGRPLGAEYVAGRRMVGGPDEPLGPPEVVAAATQASGRNPQAVAARELGGEAGRVVKETDRRGGQSDYHLLWNRGLTPVQSERVIAYELGHVIQDTAGGIPTAGLSSELRQVYNTLNTGMERTRHLTGPQHLGYKAEVAPKELMAEAIRAYLADPNYLKTVAPKTAATIRAAVNSHPTLRKIIQFNAIAGPTIMGIDLDSPGPQQPAPVPSP